MKKSLISMILVFVPGIVVAEKPDGIWAWQDDTIAEQVKVLEQGRDHPCAMTHKIVLDKMPAVSKAKEMGLEVIVEYAGRKVLKRWVVPIDSKVLAVDDENLIVSHSPGPLSVNVQGFFTLQDIQEDMSILLDSCPSFLQKEFQGADYLRCLKISDKKTNKSRYIASKGSCI